MNVFVLCTGRCGSMTFAKACAHITNFTAGHETRARIVGAARLDYPDRHIEVDNRLSWFLGRLEERYGLEACYVHLTRERQAVAESYARRFGHNSIVDAYAGGVLMGVAHSIEACLDYYDTVNANIRAFLRNKPLQMHVQLETLAEDFVTFWQWIGATGDLQSALHECQKQHNAGK